MAKRTGDEKLDFLFEGILTLKTVDECYDFFGDLCTKTELREMSKRLLAAKLISWKKQGSARRRSRASTAASATETTDM